MGAGPMTGRGAGMRRIPSSWILKQDLVTDDVVEVSVEVVVAGTYPQPGYGQPVTPQVYPSVVQQQAPEQEIVNLENYQKDLVADKADLEKEMENVQNRIEELKKLKK